MTNLNNTSDSNYRPIKLRLYYLIAAIGLIGFMDAVYLTSKYFTGTISCSIIRGCQEVLGSQYSHLGPIPLAAFGVAFYLTVLLASLIFIKYRWSLAKIFLQVSAPLAFIFSLWLTYIQIFLIRSLCQYCLLSALTSTILFILSLYIIKKK
ncbi:MAG: vitamin K epoxide reductase family protein [Patescibacteria group bacterium]